jgi:hypothetical protein
MPSQTPKAAAEDNKEVTSPAAGSTMSTITTVTTKKQEPVIGWTGVHCSFAQFANLQDLILLDSDSTDTIFWNPKYVTNITDTDQELEVMTNGGSMLSKQRCDIPYLGQV